MAKAFNVGPVTQRSMPFWCIGNPVGDPFGAKVLAPLDSLEVARLLAWAAGENLIESTSFHDDDLVPWDPDNQEDDLDPHGPVFARLLAIHKKLRIANLTVNTATCNLHGHPLFRRGGLTNPDPAVRDLARRKVERTLRIGHLLGARHFTYWVARDGFEVPVAVDWAHVYTWIAEGLDHVCEYIRAKRLVNYVGGSIEPKPNEPRGHMFLPTAGHAAGFICGRLRHRDFWKVNPELLQHESMALMNGVLTVAYLVSIGKLPFLHFGSQIKAQFDNDFPPLVGPEGLKETVQVFWALQQMGWKGLVEFDCHMLRTEAVPGDRVECRRRFIGHCVTALSMALQLAARLRPAPDTVDSESAVELATIQAMCKLDRTAVETMTRKRGRRRC